jgi:predicted Zn-dependent protease
MWCCTADYCWAADQPEEVVGVLAHEIAHVTRRHSIRNVISSAGLYLVLSRLMVMPAAYSPCSPTTVRI